MFNTFNVPTPFGNFSATPDIFGGGHISGDRGYITPPNVFGEQTIHYNGFDHGCEGTIKKDILGNTQLSYHNIWTTPPSRPISLNDL